jgi:hypothetical protein
MYSSKKLTWTVNTVHESLLLLLIFVFQACFVEACLRKEIEGQENVKTVESELKDLEQLYNEDEITKLSLHNLYSKIIKVVEDVKAMKRYEKTCFELPQQMFDEDDMAYIFQKL